MKLLVLCCAVFSLYHHGEGRSLEGCTISLNKSLPKKNEPIILTAGQDKQLTLLTPKVHGRDSFIHLRNGESIVLVCPGNRNYINETKSAIDRAVCKSGTTVTLKKDDFNFDNLDCASRASAKIKETKEKCARGKGVILNIGFEAEGWQNLVKACHNTNQGLTYYTTHTLLGTIIEGKVYRSTGRPSFSRGEKWLFKGYDVDGSYKVANQEVVLSKILGKVVLKYVNQKENKFLARGHLSPDADFVFSSWQLLTYFFVNAAPQWQSINAGNWLRVETNARNIASKLSVDLEVATGTHGICKLIDDKGKEQEIHLQKENKVPVPEYYWKILRNPEDGSCIALVSTNNPYLENPPKPICKDICARHNWPVMQNDLFKGYVYCCEYNDLKKAVKDVPDFNCKKTMVFKK